MSEELKSYEIKSLKMVHKLFGGLIPTYSSFKKKMDKFGYDVEELHDIYKLYVNNYRDDASYEGIVEPNRGDIKLVDTIKQVIKNPSMGYDDMVKLFDHPDIIGDWFYGIGERSNWRSTQNTFDVSKDGIFLYLDSEDWEKYFSGLSEDDLWYYNRIGASSYEGYYDEQDSDEFRYSLNGYPQEYRENLAELARMVGDLGFAETILKGEEEEGEFSEFLEKYFPDKHDDISGDFLNELGHIVGKARVEGIEQCYEDEIKYKGNGNANVFIPWKDLLELVIEKEIFTLSDLKDAEINGDGISLDNCWWDSYPTSEDYKDAYDSINRNVEKLIEELESGDYSEGIKSRIQIAQDMWDIVNKLGFKKQGNLFVKTTPNKINFAIESFDTEKGTFKIRIRYPKKYGVSKWDEGGSQEVKIVKYENLGTLVSSLPLNRQVETYRNLIKRVIKEEENIIPSFTGKDEIFVKKVLNSKLKPIDCWPSESNGYTWYVEFDDSTIGDNEDFRESLIYAFNSHESLSGVDESDNFGMTETISDYVLDLLGMYDYSANVFEVVEEVVEKKSKEFIKSQGYNPHEYHLDDID